MILPLLNGTTLTIYVDNGSSVRSSTASTLASDYRLTSPGGDPYSLPDSVYYNWGGYSGNIPAIGGPYVESGSAAGCKLCTGSYGIYIIIQDGQRVDGSGDFPATIPYNDGEHSGNLNLITGFAGIHPDYKDNYDAYIDAIVDGTSWSGYIYALYEATLCKNDTCVWRRNYHGAVYGPTTYYYAYVVTLRYTTS